MAQKIASFGWTGASGQQIGSSDQYPYDSYGPSFTADEVHGQKYDPNAPNTYAIPGEIGDVPVQLQDGAYYDYNDGSNGWILDNLHDPWHGDAPGTTGHNPPMGAAGTPRQHLDPAHWSDVYQLNPPGNHGIDFYGRTIEDNEVYHWQSSTTRNPNNGAFPAQAREDAANWPAPFDSMTVAGMLPVVRPTEKIPMRRPAEDDRPTYRQLAVPGQNIQPSGSVYNPTYQSNPPIHNVKPLPAFSRTPTPPWAQDELATPDAGTYPDSTDVFGGMVLQ